MKRSDNLKNRTGVVFLLIFIGLAAGILTGGFFAYQNYQQNFRVEAERQLSAIAQLKVNQLVQYRTERLGDASTFFKNPAFSNLVKRFLEQKNDGKAQQQLQTWLTRLQSYYSYEGLVLLDTRGIVRMSVPEKTVPIASVVQKTAMELMRVGGVTVQDFHRNEHDQKIYLTVLVPIIDDADPDRRLGVLLLRIDPEAYLYPFIQTWPVPSRTSETLIVRREGNDVLFLNELRFQKNTALNLRFPLSAGKLPAAQAALGHTGVIEGVDYRGESVVAALRSVPDSPWFLVARTDLTEVNAPARARLWMMVILLGALLATSGAGVGLVWRHQRHRFYREQYEMAEALTFSEVRYRRLFEAARDGILILDAETGMVVNVNPFMVELLGFSHDEFLGKKIWELGVFKDIDANKINFLELLQKEYIRYEGLPLETADGRKIEVEFVSNVYEVAHKKVIQCNIRDITERKQAEEALKVSEERHRALIDQASDGIFLADSEGRYIEVNPAGCLLLGYTREEILRKTLHELTSVPALQPLKLDELREGKSLLSEREMIRKDGSLVPVEISAKQLSGGRFQGIVRDITERKRAAEALKESEGKFRKLLESTPLPICYVNKDGVITFRNERFIKVFGYTYGEVPTLAEWWMIAYPEEHYRTWVVHNWDSAIRHAAETGTDIESEVYHVTCKNGSVREIIISGTTINDDFLATFVDITERKRAEEALTISELRYHRLFEAARDGILILDADTGMVIDVNPFLVEMLGYSHDAFLGKRIWDLGFFKDIVANKANFLELQQKEYIKYEGLPLETAAGALMNVEFVSHVYQVDRHKMIQCNIRDITERKQNEAEMRRLYDDSEHSRTSLLSILEDQKLAEEEIRTLNSELEHRVTVRTAELAEANKELEAFSYSVSHDLRAPLRSIDGFSQALLEDYQSKLDEHGKSHLLRVRNAAQRMGQLIDDVLELSRIQRAELSRVAIDLTTMAEEIVEDLQRQQTRSHVTVMIEPGMSAIGDPQLLRMCLQNLLENAWKFTSRHDQTKIEVGSRELDGKRAFFVKDDGAGFDMVHADMLFAPFQRLHAQSEFPGTGVGLASAQRVIRRHGGTIWAESEVEKGATFYFTL